MVAFGRLPIIVAPMAGGPSTPSLVAAAGNAGAFGFLGGGMRSPESLEQQIAQVRELSDARFGVNVFVPREPSTSDTLTYADRLEPEAAKYGVDLGNPEWDDDRFAEKIDVVVAAEVPVVSFTFALPSAGDVERIKSYGGTVMATVATPQEALDAVAVGADVLCVQGIDAGGHRGGLTDDGSDPAGGQYYGVLAALRLIASVVDVPLIAAGGLATGADVAAVLVAGAVAAQLGTAFLQAAEAGTTQAQRRVLAEGARPTAMTRAFSGRPARGIVNRFMTEHGAHAPVAYPQVNRMTKPIRAAAAQADDVEALSMWAGQTYPLGRQRPAAEIIAELSAEARAAIVNVRNI